jgi:hypothetical protein
MNGEIGAEAALFPEKEYINGIAFAVYSVKPTPIKLKKLGFLYYLCSSGLMYIS